ATSRRNLPRRVVTSGSRSRCRNQLPGNRPSLLSRQKRRRNSARLSFSFCQSRCHDSLATALLLVVGFTSVRCLLESRNQPFGTFTTPRVNQTCQQAAGSFETRRLCRRLPAMRTCCG